MEKVIPLGSPRRDVLENESYKKRFVKNLYKDNPELKGKKILLFAPTFRGGGMGNCSYTIEIIEAEACPDHIHMLVTIPPHLSVSSFMGYLKSKSSLMIFDKHANLKYKYGNRHFWCRGYYVDTVGRYEGAIKEYIRNQLEEDIAQDSLNFKEYTDPFTGEPVK